MINGPDRPEIAEDDWTQLPEVLHQKRARLAALVLEARGIPCRLLRSGHGWQLSVPAAEQEKARHELFLYQQENRNWPASKPTVLPQHQNTLVTLSVLGLIAIFYNLTLLPVNGFGHAPIDWVQLGNADAGKILQGQWWRTITALTLHADGLHLLGNLVIGGFFVDRLCREIGAGTGWALVLVSGALGNYLNAILQPTWHQAVGASTAVFGAVGILAVRSALLHRRQLPHQWFLPIAAAIALLGMLGSGGERTDLGAHLLGFLAGLCLGWPAAKITGYSVRLNLFAGSSAAVLLVGVWLTALASHP